jgi:hypothetical protein
MDTALGYFENNAPRMRYPWFRQYGLSSGWTPIELLKHLQYVEFRWLVWGFEGEQADDPCGDLRDDRWHVGADEPLDPPGRYRPSRTSARPMMSRWISLVPS